MRAIGRRALFATLSMSMATATACSGGTIDIGHDTADDAATDDGGFVDANGAPSSCPWPGCDAQPPLECAGSPPGSTGWTLVSEAPTKATAIGGSGPTDVWVTVPNQTSGPKLLHWNGAAWTGVPAAFDSWTVSAIAPDDAWFGRVSGTPPIGTGSGLAHWDGAGFTFVTAVPDASQVWMAAANDLWATGSTGLWHYDGSSWTLALSGQIDAVWGTASDDVWAAMSPPGIVVHWNGSNWSSPAGSPQGDVLQFAGTAPDDVWAIGQGPLVGGATSPMLAHWDGAQWSNYPAWFAGGFVASIWAAARDDVWAIGLAYGQCPDQAILHYDGTSWSWVRPEANWRVSHVWGTGPHDVWITGPFTLLHRAQ